MADIATLISEKGLHYITLHYYNLCVCVCVCVAYIVGLACTYLGLTLMQTAQPALLYLVPTTLGSVLVVSLFKKEFFLFFTGKERKVRLSFFSYYEHWIHVYQIDIEQ